MPEVDPRSLTGVNLDLPLSDRIGWNFTLVVGDASGSIYFPRDRVSVIHLDTRYSLSLAEAIAKFGESEQVSAVAGHVEGDDLGINFLYPSKGFSEEKGQKFPEEQAEHLFPGAILIGCRVGRCGWFVEP